MTNPTITQADRDAAEAFFPTCLWKQEARDDVAQAFAAIRQAAYEAGKLAGAKAMQDACAKEGKVGWVSADYDVVGIADADVAMRLCEHIESTIRSLDPATIAKEVERWA